MTVYIGTSGWQYRHWLGRLYPRKPRTPDDLAYYAERFQTVEINNSFYRLPADTTFEAWGRRAPDDFVFAIKASRYLTHILRLREPGDAVDRMLERATKLGDKLGAVLLQLPPGFRLEAARLDETLEAFDGRARVAVEFRDKSWYTDEIRALLGRHDAALCIADRNSRLLTPVWRTAEWGYLRLHAGRGLPSGCYGDHALDERARLVAELFGAGADVFVYFNNDGHGCALRDAGTFARAARRHCLYATRTAAPDAVTVP